MDALVSQAVRPQQQDRSLKIIAKSIFRELKENGYDSRQIVSLSTELIGLVTSDLKGKATPASPSQ